MSGLNFHPVLPAVALFLAAALILALRVFTLYRLLVRQTRGSLKAVLLRWGALTLAILSVVVAALRPRVDHEEQGPKPQPPADTTAAADDPKLNVFFVVDRSPNSWADDFSTRSRASSPPPGRRDSAAGARGQFRMVGIRSDLNSLVDQYPHANFSIISFSAAARVDWPLSADVWSLKALLKNYSAYNAGADSLAKTDPTAASDLLGRGLALAGSLHPEAKSLVFYLGEGRRGEAAAQGRFAPPAGTVAGGAVLGYGSAAGGQVPDHWDAGGQVVHAQGPDGPLTVAPDEGALRAIAGQLNVPYHHRGMGDAIATVLPASGLPAAGAGPEGAGAQLGPRSGGRTNRVELYWVFAMLAAALFAAEVFALVREFRRSRTRQGSA